MSEYQYYEFQAIDRPLTANEQAEIRKLSSRVQPTPTQAVFVYNYGDFRGNPEEVLAKYFDAMLYITNWGSWQLMFRLPKAIAESSLFQPYELPGAIAISATSQHLILNIEINDEEPPINGWVEGEGWLPRLLPLRDDLLRGDMRLLYWVWLRVADSLAGYTLDKDPIEPPIPPNLSQLSEPLQAFIEWVELNPDLVTAAAPASQTQSIPSDNQSLETGLSALSPAEQQEFLLKLLRREPHVDLQLINRLKELAGSLRLTPEAAPGTRRLSELTAIADRLRREREHQEQQVLRKQRIQELEALALKKTETWETVVELIRLKQSQAYDRAVAFLQELRDLADYQGQLPEFIQRVEKLKSEYHNRPALLARLKKIER